jgi:hypothetical protein
MFQLINSITRKPIGITCGTYEQALLATIPAAAAEGALILILKKEESKSEHQQDSGRLLPA